MLSDEAKHKLQDIIIGTAISWQRDNGTTTRNFPCRSYRPGRTIKKEFNHSTILKEKQIKQMPFAKIVCLN